MLVRNAFWDRLLAVGRAADENENIGVQTEIKMRSVRITIGILLWGGLLVAGAWSVDRGLKQQGHSREQIQEDVTALVTAPRQLVSVSSPRPLRFVVGDPVFADNQGVVSQIGEVAAVYPDDPMKPARSAFCNRAQIVVYDEFDSSELVLTHYTSPDSLAATIATMLPKSKRDAIAREVQKSIELNRAEIVAALKPIMEKSIRESVKVLEQELAVALRRHREDLTKLGAKYQRDLVKTEVVPLVREELIPIVRKHAQPVAEDIGQKLWDKVSLWRFGWRYLYDKSPLPERERVKTEWKRFVNKEVLPEMESRSDEIVKVVQRILSDAAKNPKVRVAVRKNLSAIIEDPEVHRIVWQVLREVMVDSPRVREVLEKTWRSPEAQAAFRLASDRFEPAAVRIGELMFGTPEGGITPEFAAVLRRQILNKDQRWLVLSERKSGDPESADDGSLTVVSGGENSAYPGRIRGAE